jgi:hypothetical protein
MTPAAMSDFHAQDFLQSIGALNAKEAGELNSLHVAMFDPHP